MFQDYVVVVSNTKTYFQIKKTQLFPDADNGDTDHSEKGNLLFQHYVTRTLELIIKILRKCKKLTRNIVLKL